MDIRIKELQKIISEANVEITSIQESCPHTHYFLSYWSYRVGHMSPAKICHNCQVYLEACSYGTKDYDYVITNNGVFSGPPLEYRKVEHAQNNT